MNSLSTFGVKCHRCEKYLGRKMCSQNVWVVLLRRQTVKDWKVKASFSAKFRRLKFHEIFFVVFRIFWLNLAKYEKIRKKFVNLSLYFVYENFHRHPTIILLHFNAKLCKILVTTKFHNFFCHISCFAKLYKRILWSSWLCPVQKKTTCIWLLYFSALETQVPASTIKIYSSIVFLTGCVTLTGAD